MNFGDASPPSPDEGEYQLRFLDLDRQIQHPAQDLDPFAHIVPIDYNLNDSLQHIRQSPNKRLILTIITRTYTLTQIQEIIQKDLMRNLKNLKMLHLFFTNGKQFHDEWRAFYAPLVQSCRSITVNLSRDLKAICATFCDLNIEFCADRAQEYALHDDRGIAYDFQQQKLKYVELTLDYKRRQYNEST
jgi:hypothetical protein